MPHSPHYPLPPYLHEQVDTIAELITRPGGAGNAVHVITESLGRAYNAGHSDASSRSASSPGSSTASTGSWPRPRQSPRPRRPPIAARELTEAEVRRTIDGHFGLRLKGDGWICCGCLDVVAPESAELRDAREGLYAHRARAVWQLITGTQEKERRG